MNGTWIQDPKTEIWHLAWQTSGESKEDGREITWCHIELTWEAPTKSGKSLDWNDTLHDECVRQSETM